MKMREFTLQERSFHFQVRRGKKRWKVDWRTKGERKMKSIDTNHTKEMLRILAVLVIVELKYYEDVEAMKKREKKKKK